jgi:peptidoglycan/LPS O-acetylase OafA/YrhL
MTPLKIKLIPEIQGLRAIAVFAVLIYHVWPDILPGGYVGVDVFFVISGFLITGSLYKEALATGWISLPGFYARRIRRLLPAATLVSVTVALFIPVFPRSQWADIANSIVASALYIQNWFLAFQAVDYLADDAKMPMTHFWSLSVEEQYYIAWPLLLLPVLYLARKWDARPGVSFAWIIGLIGVGSLAFSIYWTPLNSGPAYFATTTRAWELALGGILAVVPIGQALSNRVRALLGIGGVLAILLACVAFSTDTIFPGYAALLPTLGSGAVILSSGLQTPWSTQKILSSSGFQYLGGISYSLYLWHWPLVVLYEEISGGNIGIAAGTGIVLGSCFLAHFSKIYVEDVFLGSRFSLRHSTVIATASVAITLAAAGGYFVRGPDNEKVMEGKLPLGALALADPLYDWRKEQVASIVPKVEIARRDVPAAYANKCHQDFHGIDVLTCDSGDPASKIKIVMIGDSHATHWFPTFEEITRKHSIYFRGIAKSSCLFSTMMITNTTLNRPYTECLDWSKNVIEWLSREKPDIVLISQSPAYAETADKGMADAWAKLRALGLNVQVIRATPWIPFEPAKCLIKTNNWIQDCVPQRSSAFRRDQAFSVAQSQNLKTLDFSRYFCNEIVCPVMIGGVLLYRDSHHITTTYARTLSKVMATALALPEER